MFVRGQVSHYVFYHRNVLHYSRSTSAKGEAQVPNLNKSSPFPLKHNIEFKGQKISSKLKIKHFIAPLLALPERTIILKTSAPSLTF